MSLLSNAGSSAESYRILLVTLLVSSWSYFCSVSLLTQVNEAYMVALESFE